MLDDIILTNSKVYIYIVKSDMILRKKCKPIYVKIIQE